MVEGHTTIILKFIHGGIQMRQGESHAGRYQGHNGKHKGDRPAGKAVGVGSGFFIPARQPVNVLYNAFTAALGQSRYLDHGW